MVKNPIICAIFAINMGILYIIPTPVGNLEDITLRALRILKEADVVLAEDTRTTGLLLKHYDIQNRLLSHHKFNEHGTSAQVVERLVAGETVALVSDAGTPGISGVLSCEGGCGGRRGDRSASGSNGFCSGTRVFGIAM